MIKTMYLQTDVFYDENVFTKLANMQNRYMERY